MRHALVVCAVLLFAGMALGQATVIGGWAANQGWAGYYPAPPFIPVITTPSISLQAYSASLVGASNATFGLTAGATNSTLSMITPGSINAYTIPVWSGNGATLGGPVSAPAAVEEAPARRGKHYVEVGMAALAMGPGVSEAVKSAQANRRPATHSYTNQDIDRINQQNGTVKYRGKTEHIG
jgi:hypothetical protein